VPNPYLGAEFLEINDILDGLYAPGPGTNLTVLLDKSAYDLSREAPILEKLGFKLFI